MPRRLVFAHTVEGLFGRAYGEQLSPEQRERFQTLGLFGPTVDAEKFGEAFALLRDLVQPGVEVQVAETRMGRFFVAGYFETTMGALLKVLFRFLPLDKALMRVPQALMSGTHFIHAEVLKSAERDYVLAMNDYSTSPHFLCGIVAEMASRAGVADADIDIIEHVGRAVKIRVRWK